MVSAKYQQILLKSGSFWSWWFSGSNFTIELWVPLTVPGMAGPPILSGFHGVLLEPGTPYRPPPSPSNTQPQSQPPLLPRATIKWNLLPLLHLLLGVDHGRRRSSKSRSHCFIYWDFLPERTFLLFIEINTFPLMCMFGNVIQYSRGISVLSCRRRT